MLRLKSDGDTKALIEDLAKALEAVCVLSHCISNQ